MIINSISNLQLALDILDNNEIWSLDVETSGLNWRKDKLIGFGCANPTDYSGFYIIMKEWINGELVTNLTEEEVKPVLIKLSKKKLLGWNFNFDAAFILSQTGVNVIDALYAEVMLMVHTCDENRFEYGLKSVSASIFGSQVLTEQEVLQESIKQNGGSSKEFYKANSQIIAEYGLQDNILTCKNFNFWYNKIKQDNLEDFYFNEIVQLCKEVTFWMQYKGIPVDVPYMRQTQQELAIIMQELEDNIQTKIAPLLGNFHDWYIDTKYPFQLTGRFKAALGAEIAHELWPKTESGAVSLNAADIKKAKTYSKTELKRGSNRPLLPDNTQFENIVTGKDRCPADLVRKVQLKLLQEDGVKYTFNILSKDHLKRLFFGTANTPSLLQEKPLSTTDKGNPQIDDDFLTSVASKYDFVPLIQRFNSLTKIKSTYVDRFIDEQEDGIFYPSFHQHRTTSGRYSGDLQQLNRPIGKDEAEELKIHEHVVEYTNRVRKFFISGPGHIFADQDYDSQEVKVFAHVSNEQGIKDIFARGDDFYSSICINAENLQGYSANKKAENYLGKKNKAARQKAKAYALGLAFNMSPYKLKFELNCSEEEAKRIYDNYFNSYPNLKIWLDNSIKKACEDGFIKTEAGRIRRYPELPKLLGAWGKSLFDGLELWKEYHEYPEQYAAAKQAAKVVKNLVNNAANFQVQGLAASITNRAAIKAAKALKAQGLLGYICAVTHDQITIRCPDSELEQTSKLLQECMETAYPISVPLTAPISWGRNLAESK